jgi:predicted TIM-barrel fold metal-dependent hydrolase
MKINDAHFHLDNNVKLSEAVKKLSTTIEINSISSTMVISLLDEPWVYKDLCKELNGMVGVKYLREIKPTNKYKQNLDEILTSEAVGIKLHPRLRKFNLNDKYIHKMFKKISNSNLLIVICAFWDGTWNKFGLDIDQFANLADAYPEQKFIWAHSGGHKVLDFMLMARSRKNVFLDTSFTQHYFYGGSVLSNLTYSINSLPDRFIFGSDFENRNYKDTLGDVISRYNSLGLSPDNLNKIMYSNYEKLISIYD